MLFSLLGNEFQGMMSLYETDLWPTEILKDWVKVYKYWNFVN